ncbi:MAG: hypothetical protein OJF48_002931 [Afipia sp.]|nr:MAG: hypothetical protein OJF48_002931 [Afipia sp.]
MRWNPKEKMISTAKNFLTIFLNSLLCGHRLPDANKDFFK